MNCSFLKLNYKEYFLRYLFYFSFVLTMHKCIFCAQNRIFGLNQQLEDAKKQVSWDQQALEAWLEESARRDEDALTLKKYSKFVIDCQI